MLKELQSAEQWNNVLKRSNEKPVFVFKHSTTCPISATAYDEYLSYESDIEKYFLKVRESRAVSNKIESDLNITHQSPQIFIIQNGKALWNASHSKITKGEMEKAVKNYLN